MKRVFKMKTLLLSALLCATAFGSKAQAVAQTSNTTTCDVIIRFTAIDALTCIPIATDPTIYLVPTGGFMNITPVWAPMPTGQYYIVEEVAFAACGFPGVIVGPPPCGYFASAPLPPCRPCSGRVDMPTQVFIPGPFLPFPLNIHP